MDYIAWLKDALYTFKLSCYQMGTNHAQWEHVPCFLSSGLQKESFLVDERAGAGQDH